MSSVMKKKTRFLEEEEKGILQPHTEMVVGLETERDLEDERGEKWKKLVARSSVVPQRPLRVKG